MGNDIVVLQLVDSTITSWPLCCGPKYKLTHLNTILVEVSLIQSS
jgi:hypothetical protein